ncbi:thermopsin family protease [Sulfolobus sp. S-194]|uniref:thermopsin family protease n=1 Tax=Sulfolobus sp. S-194 TaxID=2512240 RepID=UPI00143C571A|nr:thermopsin family protease [Sulfolobus sp. S-194]
MRKYLTLALITVFLIPLISAYALILPQGYFLYIPINVNSLSALIYAIKSNVTVSVALMTPPQFNTFNETGVLKGLVVQNSSLVVNGVLLNPGEYYLVIYSPTQTANITYYYNLTQIEPENSSIYVEEFITIPSNSYYELPIHLSTLGSPSQLVLIGVSNESVKYEVYNNESQLVFESSSVTLTFNYTSFTCYYNISLPKGIYYLYIVNSHTTPALVAFEYRLYPAYVNPYLRSTLYNTTALPYGIATYGVTGDRTYTINTTSVRGFYNISSILAYNGSQSIVPQYGASLQLNAVLVINNKDNTSQILWTQNVISFITNDSAMNYCINIWNITYPSASIINSSIIGKGNLYNSSKQYLYAYGTPYTLYNLPLSGFLGINETVIPGKGVEIIFSETEVQNGTYAYSSAVIDEVLIKDPNISSAYFLVTGSQYTPAGVNSNFGAFYDAELVFGGFADGEITSFKSLTATLSLCYFNGTDYEKFPSYYTFGADTAEASGNLHVTITSQGIAKITVGTPVLGYNVVTSRSPIVIHYPTQTEVKTTTLNKTTTTTVSQITTTTVSQTSAISSQNSSQGSSTVVDIIVGVIVIALFPIVYMIMRRRK